MECKISDIHTLVNTINNKGVIAYPTEAVWGLGCLPSNEEAVTRILRLKNRALSKGLILVAANMSQFSDLLSGVPQNQLSILNESWPGSTTWLVEDGENIIPHWIKGDFSSVAIRVSNHPVIQAICESLQGPIVSTSLNTAGAMPAVTKQQCYQYFPVGFDCLVDEELGNNLSPSKIFDLASGTRVR